MEAIPETTEVTLRVTYSETDQMGVVYYARYLVWFEIARTEHFRRTGTSYKELEAQGLRLAVGEATVRYRQPARYDDVIRVRSWVRDLASRRIIFAYQVHHEDGRLLATGETSLMVLNADFEWTRLPPEVAARLKVGSGPMKSA